MTTDKDDKNMATGPETTGQNPVAEGSQANGAATADSNSGLSATIQAIKESVSEDDPKLSPSLTLRKILGGDILTTQMVRSQIWLLVLIAVFTVVYVAYRYQGQQDMITIDRLERELKDAKYKSLSISSTLTERTRASHILDMLKNNEDSLLKPADQPPYMIYVPKE